MGGVIGNYEVTIRDKKGAETQEVVGCIVVATGRCLCSRMGQFGYNGRECRSPRSNWRKSFAMAPSMPSAW